MGYFLVLNKFVRPNQKGDSPIPIRNPITAPNNPKTAESIIWKMPWPVLFFVIFIIPIITPTNANNNGKNASERTGNK